MARKIIGKMNAPDAPVLLQKPDVPIQNLSIVNVPLVKLQKQNDIPDIKKELQNKPNDIQNDKQKETPPVKDLSILFKDIQTELMLKNCIKIGLRTILIKPSKLKYHRNGTYVFYKALQNYTIDEIVMAPKGIFDQLRDGDKCLMDFVGAMLDDPKFVHDNWNDIDCGAIVNGMKIITRLDGVQEILQKREEKKLQQVNKGKA